LLLTWVGLPGQLDTANSNGGTGGCCAGGDGMS